MIYELKIPKEIVVVLAIFIVIGFLSSKRSSEFSFRLNLSPCGSSVAHEDYIIECGTVVLPQEYALHSDGTFALPDANSHGYLHLPSNSPTVELPLIIFTPTLETDAPLVLTGAGGPGSSMFLSMHDALDVNNYLDGFMASTVVAGRKLILLDIRGSFGATPFLGCQDYTKLVYKQMVTGQFNIQDRLAIDKKCANDFTSRSINLGLFNIDNAVRDVESIRHILGIHQWHVYGVSHGTRIAMHYARLFPERTKSIVLDSIFPFDVDSALDYAVLNEKALLQPFSRCDFNDTCTKLFARSATESFLRLRENLKLNPLSLMSTHVNDKFESVTESITVTDNTIDALLIAASYDEEVINTLPSIIKEMEVQNYEPFLQFFANEMEYAILGMFADIAYTSFACYEEDLFLDIEQAIYNTEHVELDRLDSIYELQNFTYHCDIFEVEKADYSIKNFDTNTLGMPVLILSGALDVATPLHWAQAFYDKLPNKGITQHLKVWPEKAHAVLNGNKCADLLVADFLNNPHAPLNDISLCSN